jgi:hypothetical protein
MGIREFLFGPAPKQKESNIATIKMQMKPIDFNVDVSSKSAKLRNAMRLQRLLSVENPTADMQQEIIARKESLGQVADLDLYIKNLETE